jgi:WD40 repeat protein
MLRTSGLIWVKAVVLSTGATALIAAFLGLLHLRNGGAVSEPTNHITVCDCILDGARQSAVAMIGSTELELPFRRRKYLVGLELRSSNPKLTLLSQDLEPISVGAGPDGRVLVAAADGGVYSINPQSPSDAAVLMTRHKQPPFRVASSSDGRWLVTLESKQLCVWDLPSRELQWRKAGSVVCSVALVPNSDVILCGMADGSVMELSIETGEDLRRINRHQQSVMSLAVSSHGDRVASYCAGQEIRVTDRLTGASIWRYSAGKYSRPLVEFSHDGRRLVTAEFMGREPIVHLWDLANGKGYFDLKGLGGLVIGAEFLSDEELLTWGIGGTLCRWSLADGSLLQAISLPWSGSLDLQIGSVSMGPQHAD